MIWELPGLSVGHWADPEARTGCTVVLAEPAVTASGEVRGGAPATREFAVLDPLATVDRIDAVLLTGGSAFGLSAADGVMRWCEQQDRGVPTPAGRVPIVVAMGLYDLAVGDASVRPGPDDGWAACEAAASGAQPALGRRAGAGCGATVGSWRGAEASVDGGLVGAVRRHDGITVAALAAVNPWGDVSGVGAHGEPWPEVGVSHLERGATTIGVVATDAELDKAGCHHLARSAHDGLARAITPPHSGLDGDAFVAMSTGTAGPAPRELVCALAVEVVEEAIRSLTAHG